MISAAYYNEVDPYAAEWLRNLIAQGHIAPGDVDERDIRDVRPDDLDGYTQCHFFAGVGIWSAALRVAGWPNDKPIWTGSCPCQPFSAAGAGVGFEDERHLWPDWHWLIEQCRPETVFGEQVASKDGLGWADLVSSDLEATDYAFGAVDTCAAGFRSFHIRQRLYFAATDSRSSERGAWRDVVREFGGVVDGEFSGLEGHGGDVDDGAEPGRNRAKSHGSVAEAGHPNRLEQPHGGDVRAERQQRGGEQRLQPIGGGCVERVAQPDERQCGRVANGGGGQCDGQETGRIEGDSGPKSCGAVGGVSDTADGGCRSRAGLPDQDAWGGRQEPADNGCACRSHDASCDGRIKGRDGDHSKYDRDQFDPSDQGGLPWFIRDRHTILPDAPDTSWRDADWLFCRDGKWRPVGPGAFPLAHAAPARVGRLRAYGNGLDLAQAAGFVSAFMTRDQGKPMAENLLELMA